MMTSAAAISNEVRDYFRKGIGAPFVEAYGLTECSGLGTCNYTYDKTMGHVGGVSVSLEMKLVDVSEMGYLTTDVDDEGNLMPRGEICLRGYGVVPGYYKMDEKAKEAIDDDGWLRTGDVGMLNTKNGALTIIDKKKNLFKLSQGHLVAPEKVESILNKIPYFAEAFVYGDSLKDYCVGLFVLDE